MAKKISIKKKDEFFRYIADYYMSNKDKLVKLGEVTDGVYDEGKDFSYIISIAFISLALYDEYNFDEKYSKEFNKHLYLKEYDKCIEICEYLHSHAYYAVTASWKDYPNDLSRHFLISARSSISDLMYVLLTLFRCDGGHQFKINYKDVSFQPLPLLASGNSLEDVLPGELYGISAIAMGGCSSFIYDFGDWWDFKIRFRKPVIIEDNPNSPVIILQKGKGYGIFEDNKFLLENYLCDPDMMFEGMPIKELMQFDLNDPCVSELKKTVNKDFQNLKNMIEEMTVEENPSNFDTEDEDFMKFLEELEEAEDSLNNLEDDSNNYVS